MLLLLCPVGLLRIVHQLVAIHERPVPLSLVGVVELAEAFEVLAHLPA